MKKPQIKLKNDEKKKKQKKQQDNNKMLLDECTTIEKNAQNNLDLII